MYKIMNDIFVLRQPLNSLFWYTVNSKIAKINYSKEHSNSLSYNGNVHYRMVKSNAQTHQTTEKQLL